MRRLIMKNFYLIRTQEVIKKIKNGVLSNTDYSLYAFYLFLWIIFFQCLPIEQVKGYKVKELNNITVLLVAFMYLAGAITCYFYNQKFDGKMFFRRYVAIYSPNLFVFILFRIASIVFFVISFVHLDIPNSPVYSNSWYSSLIQEALAVGVGNLLIQLRMISCFEKLSKNE